MPRPRETARQRIVFCDCFDCSDKAIEPTVRTEEGLAASDLVAQQRPPPKAIVLFGSGLLHSWQGSHSLNESEVPSLDQVTKEGCLGVVALRPAAQPPDGLSPGAGELHQWCNLSSLQGVPQQQPMDDTATPGASSPDAAAPSTFAGMFQGMQVVAASNDAGARTLLSSLGAALPEQLQLQGTSNGAAADTAQQEQPQGALPASLPEPVGYAAHMLTALGAGEAASGPDMLLVHLDRPSLQLAEHQQQDGGEAGDGAAVHQVACSGLRWLDALAGALLQQQHVREQVLLCVLLTSLGDPAPASGPDRAALQSLSLSPAVQVQAPALLQQPGALLDPAARVATPRDAYALQLSGASGDALHGLGLLAASDDAGLSVSFKPLAVPRPLQSWQRRGLQRVEVDVQAPALCARRLPGVMRRDRAEALSFEEALVRGGLGATLVDHVLPEIAYKLGRAPKYGA